MDLKTIWTTRKVRRGTDPQDIQTKRHKQNVRNSIRTLSGAVNQQQCQNLQLNHITQSQMRNGTLKTCLQIIPPQEQKTPTSESIFLS